MVDVRSAMLLVLLVWFVGMKQKQRIEVETYRR